MGVSVFQSRNPYEKTTPLPPRWCALLGLALKSVDIIKHYVNKFKPFAPALSLMGAPSSVRRCVCNVSRLAGAGSTDWLPTACRGAFGFSVSCFG